MDNTVKGTWIDKLVDELVDTKNENTDLKIEQCKSENLIALIFDNLRLNYAGDGMTLDNVHVVLGYIKAVYTYEYMARFKELKADREAEIAKLKADQEAKGKKEA